jgi:exonuclease III
MKILSWNCRGLANTSTIRSLRSIIKLNHPDIIFLSETKTDPAVASNIMNQLGFPLLL